MKPQYDDPDGVPEFPRSAYPKQLHHAPAQQQQQCHHANMLQRLRNQQAQAQEQQMD